MARLTRSLLTALGMDDEGKQTEVINAHRETVDALKEERDRLREQVDKIPDLEKQLEAAKKSSEDDKPYKEKYDKLKEEYDGYKSEVEGREAKAKKTAAYKALLQKAGISEKRLDSVLKVSDVDSIEFDDKGEVKDSDGLVKKIKTEWEDFIPKDEKKGATPATPPKGAGGEGGTSGERSRAAQVASKYYGNLYGGRKEGEKT